MNEKVLMNEFDVALEQGWAKWSDAEQNSLNCKTPGVWVLTKSLLPQLIVSITVVIKSVFIKDLNER